MASTQAPDDGEYVYFHAGQEAAFRKVSAQPTGFTTIPTIDLKDMASSPEARKRIAAQVYDAAHRVGFFYVANHGIPEEVVAETQALLQRFFSLDLEAKMDAHVHKNPAIRGYEPLLETQLDPRTAGDLKEAFTMGDCVREPEQDYTGRTGQQPPARITQPQNIWPSAAPWWREGLYRYYSHVLPLALNLVRVVALSLGLAEDALDGQFRFPITGMRALYYPPVPPPAPATASASASASTSTSTIGLGAHADFSWLTLVLQLGDVPALEVLNPDGRWVDAPPVPGTLVCNVGQYLERHTNGIFPATVHRVRNRSGETRYSLPFFLTPDPDVDLAVLDVCKSGDTSAPKYETINVGDLYVRRVLPARKKHPTSIKYREVPPSEWKYDMLLR